MTKDKPEPREYQLVWDEADGWQVGSLNNSETYSDIHVIEYAAYELLKAKLDRALDGLNEIKMLTHCWVIAEKTIDCKHKYVEIRAKTGLLMSELSEGDK